MNDPKALNMNGGQTVHGGQIGENIHNYRRPVYYGKRMIGKCIQFFPPTTKLDLSSVLWEKDDWKTYLKTLWYFQGLL